MNPAHLLCEPRPTVTEAMGKEPEKGLTDAQKDHLCGVLRPVIDERFDGNATAAAKAMRIPQPQLSQILQGKRSARSAGIQVLVRIRAFMGMPIDDLLGLPALPWHATSTAPPKGDPDLRAYVREIIREERLSERPKKGPDTHAPPSRPRRRP